MVHLCYMHVRILFNYALLLYFIYHFILENARLMSHIILQLLLLMVCRETELIQDLVVVFLRLLDESCSRASYPSSFFDFYWIVDGRPVLERTVLRYILPLMIVLLLGYYLVLSCILPRGLLGLVSLL